MPFAIIRAEVPVKVFPGVPFVSSQLKILTDDEAAWAMSPVGSIIDADRSHSAAALDAYTADDRARFCIHSYAHPVPPQGQVLMSYTLALDGDSIVATGVFSVPPVPQEVSRLQAKQALRAGGKLTDVETAIAGASDEVKIYWADASMFHRDHPTLLAMATALGMSSDEVDALFRAAAAIT